MLQAQEEGNVTVSVLKFTPKAEDDGAMLICQATNEKLPDQAVQDSRLLSINCECVVKGEGGRGKQGSAGGWRGEACEGDDWEVWQDSVVQGEGKARQDIVGWCGSEAGWWEGKARQGDEEKWQGREKETQYKETAWTPSDRFFFFLSN